MWKLEGEGRARPAGGAEQAVQQPGERLGARALHPGLGARGGGRRADERLVVHQGHDELCGRGHQGALRGVAGLARWRVGLEEPSTEVVEEAGEEPLLGGERPAYQGRGFGGRVVSDWDERTNGRP